jgi:hypothetical protein
MRAAGCGSLLGLHAAKFGCGLGKCGARTAADLTTTREPALIEQHIDIATADGAMNSFVVHPEEGGPFPVVLFCMDAPGYRQELRDWRGASRFGQLTSWSCPASTTASRATSG